MGKDTVFLLPVRYCFIMFLEGPNSLGSAGLCHRADVSPRLLEYFSHWSWTRTGPILCSRNEQVIHSYSGYYFNVLGHATGSCLRMLRSADVLFGSLTPAVCHPAHQPHFLLAAVNTSMYRRRDFELKSLLLLLMRSLLSCYLCHKAGMGKSGNANRVFRESQKERDS
jgi:hypothetical protein